MNQKFYQKQEELKHFGVLGMRWGHRKTHPETQTIIDRANKILNNPKSSEKDMNSAFESIGIDPKTGKKKFTKPVYDKSGNDISVNPERRLFKKKGQSDKEFDKEFDAEMSLDPDQNPTPANLSRRRISDLQEDHQAKLHGAAMIAAVAGVAVIKYVAMHQINKAAKEAILKKYGPELANMIIKSKGL